MGTDIMYCFQVIAWESCYTLHCSNIRSHQRHINTSSQQSDKAGTCHPGLTQKELKQNIHQFVQHCSEQWLQTSSSPCRTGYCFNPWPTTHQLPCWPTYLKLLPESEKWEEWKEITERKGWGGLHLIKDSIFVQSLASQIILSWTQGEF